jgi:parvulin-like peptidyl-prolyl isomerase
MKISTGSKYVTLIVGAALSFAQQPPPQQPPAQQPPAQTKPATLRPPSLAPGQPKAQEGPLVIVAPDTVVLTVGTEKMTRAQFEELLAALADSGRPATTPAQKRQVAEQLGELKSMAQEARKRKLDQDGQVKQMMMIQSENVLAAAVAKQVAAEVKPDEAAMHAYYDQNKTKFETAKASHILIRFKGSRVPLKAGQKELTDEEALAKAQAVRKQLQDGGDFAAIAKAETDDTGTAAAGGSLGTFNRGQMVPEFDAAAFSLPIGQLSEPVKSAFGYHLIKVEERKAKTFEEARPDIEKQLKSQMGRDAVERLKKQTPVTLDESYFPKQ